MKARRRVCLECGTPLNEFEFVFRPLDSGEWRDKIEQAVGETVSLSIEEGKRMRIRVHHDLTPEQRNKLTELMKKSDYIDGELKLE